MSPEQPFPTFDPADPWANIPPSRFDVRSESKDDHRISEAEWERDHG